MYKIIGANQVEYGPVNADQVRQWIAEGRVNAETSVQAAGETTWRPIAAVPEFAASFASQPPPPVTPPPTFAPQSFGGHLPEATRARALDEVNGPAVGLMIVGILGIVYAIFGVIWSVFGSAFSTMQFNSMNFPGQNPDMMRMMQGMSGFTGVIASMIHAAASVFILFGALKLKKLENHSLAIAACIVALIPCFCPCCLINIPIGIWALTVINRQEIRSHFV